MGVNKTILYTCKCDKCGASFDDMMVKTFSNAWQYFHTMDSLRVWAKRMGWFVGTQKQRVLCNKCLQKKEAKNERTGNNPMSER